MCCHIVAGDVSSCFRVLGTVVVVEIDRCCGCFHKGSIVLEVCLCASLCVVEGCICTRTVVHFSFYRETSDKDRKQFVLDINFQRQMLKDNINTLLVLMLTVISAQLRGLKV